MAAGCVKGTYLDDVKLGAVLVVGCCGVALTACGSTRRAVVISGHAIGAVRLGAPRAAAVQKLSAIFGQAARVDFTNDGCAPTYTEVAWKHLYAEFTRGRLSGYRYIEQGWPPRTFSTRPTLSDLPRLVTSRGVTLGSTLSQARTAYGRLKLVGTNRWETADGLILYDNATTYPDPLSSRIIEIKITSTCGDF